jgi:hypothetical protein
MKRIILLLLIISELFAGNFNKKDFPNTLLKTYNYKSGNYYVDTYKMNIDNTTAKRVLNRMNRYRAIMNDSYEMKILLKPLVNPLTNISVVYLHPNFISTIIFPASFKITSAQNSLKMNLFTYSQNLIELKPLKGNDIGNMVVTAYDKKTKQNKIFNFILKNYSFKDLTYDKEYGMYAIENGSFFSLTNKFVEKININPIKILQKYVEVNGLKKFNQVFAKNNSYDSILIDNVPIYITRDDIQGSIEYFNKKFRITIGVKQ